MTDIEKVKALIQLMHEGNVLKLEVGDIKLEISPVQFFPQDSEVSNLPEEKGSSRTLVDDIDKKDDDDMLFWSVRPGV